MSLSTIHQTLSHLSSTPIFTGIMGTITSSWLALIARFEDTLPVVQWFAGMGAITVAFLTCISIIYGVWNKFVALRKEDAEQKRTEEKSDE